MTYTVEIAKPAQRELKKLDAPIRRKVSRRIDLLANDPRPSGVTQLTSVSPPVFRVRAVNATLWPTAPEVNRKYADFDAVLMENVGHFLMQEAPEALNHHLRTVIAELETG